MTLSRLHREDFSDLPFLVFIVGSLNFAANLLQPANDTSSQSNHAIWRTIKFSLRMTAVSFLLTLWPDVQALLISTVSSVLEHSHITMDTKETLGLRKEDFVNQMTEWFILMTTCSLLMASSTLARFINQVAYAALQGVVRMFCSGVEFLIGLFKSRIPPKQDTKHHRKMRREL